MGNEISFTGYIVKRDLYRNGTFVEIEEIFFCLFRYETKEKGKFHQDQKKDL